MIDNDPTQTIARRLKAERDKRQWTLDQLAQHTGVSKAMLSKLERGVASPTAVLLGRISGARLVRVAEQPLWQDPQTGYLRRQVSPLSDLPVQLVEVELPPKAEVGFPASAYAFIRQLIWVLDGTLEFTEGPQTHRLQAGDCLELGEPSDCVFRNPGRSVCRYLVAVARR